MYLSISFSRYTNRIPAISFILPINWTNAIFYWYKANINDGITVKTTSILYKLSVHEFASRFFAAVISSALSKFQI